MAERVGFEPTVAEIATHALQACLLDHSSTSPLVFYFIVFYSSITIPYVLKKNRARLDVPYFQ